MAGPSIVIVACDPYLAGIYGRKFERDGWGVEIAETLDEGEKKAVKQRPAVLLLDDGCVADVAAEIKRLKSLPTLQKTEIIVLAAQGDREEIERALKAGARDYLILGHFVPQEAVQKLRKLLK